MIESFKNADSKYVDIEIIKKSEDDNRILGTYKAKKNVEASVILKEIPYKKKELYSRLIGKKHENVCEINEIISNSKETLFLVEMEHIEGQTLADYVENKKTLSIKETINFAIQLCDGLEFLHSNGIIHKDLSASNIIVSDNKKIKIIDFGYSRIDDEEKNFETTNIYSWGVTAPEITTGNKVDTRADIYSLGKLMKYMLTGDAFSSNYKEKSKLSKIIRKCMSVDADDRYKKVKEVKKELQELIPEKKKITKIRANVRLAVAMVISFMFAISVFSLIMYVPPVDNSDKYTELSKINQQWSEIYNSMNVLKDYDNAILKLEELMADGSNPENVYVCYAKCLIGKKEYDNAADSLIGYIRDVYKYPNMTNDTMESYTILIALESQVSPEKAEEIKQVRTDVEKHIARWNDATEKFRKKEYDSAIEQIDSLFADGAKVDVGYFLKIECLLAKGKKGKAKKVYEKYGEVHNTMSGRELIDYDTVSYYDYEEELYQKIIN